ncbi:MAG TPA: hypothetical protein VES97_04280, partial [Solirubrobacteraceae bacterium]|nr:hypothetical protein [Solirubrobacteraceae bacterium]
GQKEYETCTGETGCKAGLAGNKKFELNGAQGIAIDNSTSGEDPSRGDLYVVADTTEEHEKIEKFGPKGERLDVIERAEHEELEEVHGVAVDASGTVWVYKEEEIDRFSDGQPNKGLPPAVQLLIGGEPGPGIAVGPHGELYLGHEGLFGSELTPNVIGKIDAGGEPPLEAAIEELDSENTTAVAVDLASGSGTPLGEPANGDVYVDNVTSVAVFDSSATLVQRLGNEHGEQHLGKGSGVGVDSHTGDVYVADASANVVDVFTAQEPGTPTVEETSVQDVTSESAQLNAQIDPNNAETSYAFRYAPGKVPPAGEGCATPCVELPEGTIAAGFGDQPASGKAQGLQPGTTYHYRVLATNTVEEDETTAESEEGEFTTPPATGEFTADARGWELVSPPDKGGAAIEPLTEAGGAIQASANGRAITYVADAPVGEPEGSRSLEVTQLISSRGKQGGWSTRDIITPNDQGIGLSPGNQEYRLFSTSLALGLLQPSYQEGTRFAEPPLSPPVSEEETAKSHEKKPYQEKTIYLRNDVPIGSGAPEAEAAEAMTPETPEERANYARAREGGEIDGNPGYLALVTAANVLPGVEFGGQLEFVGATSDLSHVVIKSNVALTPGSAAGENLYEWAAGSLQP